MHFSKEYILKYNTAKEIIKSHLSSIEIELDRLEGVKGLNTIEECREFISNVIVEPFDSISEHIEKISFELNLLQMFCHEDVKNIIPSIIALEDMEEDEAFSKAKDIDWLIGIIGRDDRLDKSERYRLLDISEFNKKVRYFIHSTLAIVQNPLPITVLNKIKNNIKKGSMISTADVLSKDVNYCMSEVYRIKKSIEQFHILSNSDYGNWASEKISCEELKHYFEVYKHRFENYFFKEKIYNIKVNIFNELGTKNLSIPLDKIKEVIDVFLHNAAEELVDKEGDEGEFEKTIICTIKDINNKCCIEVQDNGRGIEADSIDKAFYSTKANSKNYGIGLDIAKKNSIIVKGELLMINDENSGAIFRLIFPYEIRVDQTGFGHKLNVVTIGQGGKKINAELEKITKEHISPRVIRASDDSAVKGLIKDKILDAVDVIVIEKDNSIINEWLKKSNFKGKLITA